MTILAALAALEQELRALSASQFRSMEKADVADKSGTADAYEMAAESNLASANRLAALRVRLEGEERPRQHHPDCDMAVADCTCHMYEAPGPDPEQR